jgi:hypothetical protein
MPNDRASRPTEAEDNFCQELDATIAKRHQAHKDRLSVKYDGVLGPPPPWFPKHAERAFLSARRRLLNEGGLDGRGHDPEEIRRLISQAIEEEKSALAHREIAINYNTFMVPPRDREAIYTLAHLWAAFKLGPVRGLKKMAGEDAAIGYRSRTAHQRRKTSTSKRAVQKIGHCKWKANRTLTIKAILGLPEVRRLPGADRTKREWLSAIDPRPRHKKQGRPRKQK